jgi:hypothetical protein
MIPKTGQSESRGKPSRDPKIENKVNKIANYVSYPQDSSGHPINILFYHLM